MFEYDNMLAATGRVFQECGECFLKHCNAGARVRSTVKSCNIALKIGALFAFSVAILQSLDQFGQLANLLVTECPPLLLIVEPRLPLNSTRATRRIH
ncbi:hypothetical protein CFB47_30155 [Burkholderia sp. AU27893]|uniref:Uncharacterized protein n=1 Tax=Burkholderia contaminans TaxID=488447 RepID=A0A2S5E3J7_9BURK|nr:hypothetical protein CFB47_30155 [Burkholderia sp. AU27893]POZ85876.1 hypothetical protein C3743_04920 [Burkholderia contaminans]